MADTNIFDELLSRHKKLSAPMAPPPTAQERFAEMPGQEGPKQQFLDQFIMGKLTEAAPTPGVEFENFFRSRYSPAQEFVSNFIRGAVATGKGVEASNVREESLKEFQIFQRDQQAAREAQIRTLGIFTNLMQDRARIASDEKQAANRLELDQAKHELDSLEAVADWNSRYIMAELAIKKGGVEAERAQKEMEQIDFEMRPKPKDVPSDPLQYATALYQEANPDKSFATPEAQAQIRKDVRLLTAAKKPPADPTPQVLPQDVQNYAAIFSQTGDLNYLHDKVPEAAAQQIIRELTAEHKIVGYAKPLFVKAVAPVIAASSAFKEYSEFAILAKGSKPDDPALAQKAYGLLSKLEGMLGTDPNAAMVAKFQAITGITLAKAAGEIRTTDADAKTFARAAVTQTNTLAEIEKIVKFQQRRFYSSLDTQLKGLVQFGGPAPHAGTIKYEDIDKALARQNAVFEAAGEPPLNVADFMRLRREAGYGFE